MAQTPPPRRRCASGGALLPPPPAEAAIDPGRSSTHRRTVSTEPGRSRAARRPPWRDRSPSQMESGVGGAKAPQNNGKLHVPGPCGLWTHATRSGSNVHGGRCRVLRLHGRWSGAASPQMLRFAAIRSGSTRCRGLFIVLGRCARRFHASCAGLRLATRALLPPLLRGKRLGSLPSTCWNPPKSTSLEAVCARPVLSSRRV